MQYELLHKHIFSVIAIVVVFFTKIDFSQVNKINMLFSL